MTAMNTLFFAQMSDHILRADGTVRHRQYCLKTVVVVRSDLVISSYAFNCGRCKMWTCGESR